MNQIILVGLCMIVCGLAIPAVVFGREYGWEACVKLFFTALMVCVCSVMLVFGGLFLLVGICEASKAERLKQATVQAEAAP